MKNIFKKNIRVSCPPAKGDYRGWIIVIFLLLFAASAHQASASAFPKPPNNLGLVGYWSMNDCSTNKATDFSGNGNTGTLTNFALTGSTSNWTTNGKRGCALAFDGSDDYVSVSSAPSLNPTGAAVTLSAWVKATGNLNNDYFNKGVAGKWVSTNQYTLWTDATDNALGYKFTVSTSGGSSGTAKVAVSDANWHHIVGVFDGASKLYIDGVLQSTGSSILGNINSGSGNFSIGDYQDGAGVTRMNANIDEVRVYNRALTGPEVTALYNSGSVTIKKPPSVNGNFNPLSQTSRAYRGMAAAPNGNVYAVVENGDIYMQTGGVGNFNALGQTSRTWYGITVAPNGNVYAAVVGGDIYMQTAGVGTFNALGQTSRNWIAMTTTANGNVYAAVLGGDIYMQTGGAGNFVGLGQTSRNWIAMTTAPNGNVYAAPFSDDIYMQTAGTGNFVALSQTPRVWGGMAAEANGNVYISVQAGDIYMQTGGAGNFVGLGQTTRGWYGMARATSGNVYASVLNGDIYMRSVPPALSTTIVNKSTAEQGGSLTSGLVGHWTFDGSKLTTTTATNSGSGGGGNGTLSGTTKPSPILGKLGQALSFDGSTSYVTTFSSVNSFSSSNSHTFSAWTRQTSYKASDYAMIISYSAANSSSLGYRGAATNGVLTFFYNPGFLSYSTSTATPLDRWVHVVASYNSGTNTVTLYLDGVAVGTSGALGSWSSDSITAPGIGRYNTAANNFFNGSIDDVRVYNRALTASEVTTLYNLGR